MWAQKWRQLFKQIIKGDIVKLKIWGLCLKASVINPFLNVLQCLQMINWGVKSEALPRFTRCTCLLPKSFHLTLYMKTLRRVLYVCMRLCFGWGFSVVRTSENICSVEFSPLLPRTESWALTSYQQLPLPFPLKAPHSIPPLLVLPLFPYWRAWKGSTARGQSSGGSLLNCLLSGG